MLKTIRSATKLMMLAGILAGASAYANPTYVYYDLGEDYLPTAISPGLVVNNNTTTTYIAGNYTGGSASNAFYIPLTWAISSQYVPVLGDAVTLNTPLSASVSYATGVNDSGYVCGYYSNSGATNQGYVEIAGAPPTNQALFDSASGYSDVTFARAINASGAVAGWDDTVNEGFLAPDTATDVTDKPSPATIPAESNFYGINGTGDAAGFANFSTNPMSQVELAGIWDSVTSSWVEINGSSGGIGGAATGITHHATMYTCGYTFGSTPQAWRCDTAYTAIGTTSQEPSQANGINDGDVVVGYFTSSSDSYSHAFVSYSGSTLVDLQDTSVVTNLPSNVHLTNATAVSYVNYTFGDIVGVSEVVNLEGSATDHGFLLVQQKP